MGHSTSEPLAADTAESATTHTRSSAGASPRSFLQPSPHPRRSSRTIYEDES
ncbi:uncharacterized protein ATNIH1004_009865 [Aspergillus tanneri]|uniref:Uncharacterized protein n=1 Tax=Aspergillus tanneri TaxID=1220188 RepID=A0A5M9MDR1_9EURO|nr:uncharacterized protein ATNIH1004_009865 [Aspergillus tanneri]KAA8643103.1 hypothetical protein ATNIH1004_009865 [Aspergillus tanneri]